ncbi:hypothetical protein BGZ76_001276 [Entomortierella beljakovae]|nr:hypothetical protein BGZ76_001276 [Entomortierella beljakovae]
MTSKESSKQDPPEVAEFQKELYSLFDSRAASASKIDRLTKLAIKAARYYKNIVYYLEKFITRCVPEYKLTGLYVLDSICRTSQSVKTKSSSGPFSGSEYVGRFERNIEALFAEFCKVQEDKEKEKVKRVVDLWERSGTFASTVTENIKKKYFPLLETSSETTNTTSQLDSQADSNLASTTNDNSVEKAALLISSLAASLSKGNEHANSPSTQSAQYASLTTSTEGSSNPISYVSSHASSHANGQNLTVETPSAFTSRSDNPLLAGISDPSSALALQTLLATVSQVKAATAVGTSAGPGQYPAYSPSATLSAAPQAPIFQMPAHSLPPVLQQLQGALMNSNQNGAILPNNNTMSTGSIVPPFLHNDSQSRNSLIGGNSSGISSGTAPRDPRIDPRLVAQQEQAQPHVFRTQPQPQLSTPAGMLPNGSLGAGLDGQALAQLTSLLNPLQNTPLPIPPHLLSMQISANRMHQGIGRGLTTETPYGNQPGQPGLSNFPNRPQSGHDAFSLHQNDTNNNQPGENMQSSQPGVKEDTTISPEQIRVISRTLWVGGTFIPTVSEQDLEAIFSAKGNIATIMINHAKFNAFIKMADRAQAERCKADLDRTMVKGEVMKVGWGCGFGPRECFDYTTGTSIIPLDRLTDTDRRWLGNSIIGGFGQHEPIRGGVAILEPNIEPVSSDGREAIPKRSKNPNNAGVVPTGGNIGGGGRGGRGGGFSDRGRGRGRGMGGMDHAENTNASRGRGAGIGRGRGSDEQSDLRSHPLPNRPQIGLQGQGNQGWPGKRDPGSGLSQRPQQQGLPAWSPPASSTPYQQHSHEDEVRPNKKSRWE